MGYIQGWYGGGSWVILAFLALALFRIFAARSRRGGMPPGRPGRGRPWMSGPGPASHFAPPPTKEAGQVKGEDTGHGIPAGWFADPSGRYEQRYWSGTGWTEHVTRGGVPSVDQPPTRDGDPAKGSEGAERASNVQAGDDPPSGEGRESNGTN